MALPVNDRTLFVHTPPLLGLLTNWPPSEDKKPTTRKTRGHRNPLRWDSTKLRDYASKHAPSIAPLIEKEGLDGEILLEFADEIALELPKGRSTSNLDATSLSRLQVELSIFAEALRKRAARSPPANLKSSPTSPSLRKIISDLESSPITYVIPSAVPEHVDEDISFSFDNDDTHTELDNALEADRPNTQTDVGDAANIGHTNVEDALDNTHADVSDVVDTTPADVDEGVMIELRNIGIQTSPLMDASTFYDSESERAQSPLNGDEYSLQENSDPGVHYPSELPTLLFLPDDHPIPNSEDADSDGGVDDDLLSMVDEIDLVEDSNNSENLFTCLPDVVETGTSDEEPESVSDLDQEDEAIYCDVAGQKHEDVQVAVPGDPDAGHPRSFENGGDTKCVALIVTSSETHADDVAVNAGNVALLYNDPSNTSKSMPPSVTTGVPHPPQLNTGDGLMKSMSMSSELSTTAYDSPGTPLTPPSHPRSHSAHGDRTLWLPQESRLSLDGLGSHEGKRRARPVSIASLPVHSLSNAAEASPSRGKSGYAPSPPRLEKPLRPLSEGDISPKWLFSSSRPSMWLQASLIPRPLDETGSQAFTLLM